MFKEILAHPMLGGATKLLEDGGAVVAILLGLAVFVGTVIIVKLLQLLWIFLTGKRKVRRSVQLWVSGKQQEALDLIASSSAPTASVLRKLMQALIHNPDKEKQIREDIERVASDELGKIRSGFRAIEAVVQIAPLLGLFGTVLGMIEAFQNLQAAGTEVDPSILAGGIWVALLTTAVGLAVAIPSAFILYGFEAMAEKEQSRMEDAVTSILTNRLTEKGSDKSETQKATDKKVISVNDAA